MNPPNSVVPAQAGTSRGSCLTHVSPPPEAPASAGATHIAPLSPDEAESAIGLWDEANLLRPWNDPRADIAAALACPTANIFAARAGGRIVATAMAGYDGHRGWLYYLAVADSHRGTGLGREIVTAAEEWLVALGAGVIRLMVRTENERAAGFYEALGYERGDLIVMGKRIG